MTPPWRLCLTPGSPPSWGRDRGGSGAAHLPASEGDAGTVPPAGVGVPGTVHQHCWPGSWTPPQVVRRPQEAWPRASWLPTRACECSRWCEPRELRPLHLKFRVSTSPAIPGPWVRAELCFSYRKKTACSLRPRKPHSRMRTELEKFLPPSWRSPRPALKTQLKPTSGSKSPLRCVGYTWTQARAYK